MTDARWQFFIDRGGTFTDCIGLEPKTGELHVEKILSDDRAPLTGIRKILGLAETEPIPACHVRMGTTLATNALLERKGRATALLVTEGFADLTEIGTQARPDIFALAIEKPEPLHAHVLTCSARMRADGTVLEELDVESLQAALLELKSRGIESLAISLLHAYRNDVHERLLAEQARRLGFGHVAESHDVAREIGYLARTDTTLLDAYLTPLLLAYTTGIASELGEGSLHLMQSSGGLTEPARFRGPNAILSGPAGGVVAVGHIAKQRGIEHAIGLDMGGTSTDVCRVDVVNAEVELPRVYESEVAGVRIRAPMMDIHTVASGGGSLCRATDGRLSVGPESAGAAPGPLCYGNPEATELALTDVNLVLGRVVPAGFPIPLDAERPREKLARLARELTTPLSPEELAEGFFDIAVSDMSEAIRKMTVARGVDAREHTLVVFGGAGGQHACAIARRLGILRVAFPPLGGVLSALGMGLARPSWHGESDAARAVLGEIDLEPAFRALEERGLGTLRAEGHAESKLTRVRRMDLRYRGADSVITLRVDAARELRARFHDEHAARFGHQRPEHPIEVVCVRVEVMASVPALAPKLALAPTPKAETNHTRLFVNGRWHEGVPLLRRESLRPNTRLDGPLVVLDPASTLVVEPDFALVVEADGFLVAEATGRSPTLTADSERVDPVLLEILGNRFMSIAEQMGEALRRTAFSTNIRERLDFSCALFDAEGNLVANAPHIPVHLGAMGESVRAVIERNPELLPGDVFVTNDPACGGSHLPDITVVTPIHGATGELEFFTACRGHHADIGGTTPGSMPAFSSTLAEEGVVLSAERIVRNGHLDRERVRSLFLAGPHPARQVDTNLLDLEAQIAANQTGARLLAELTREHGSARIQRYMAAVMDDGARRVALQIARLADGDHAFSDSLDDGTIIAVTLRVRGDRLRVDFSGTGPESAGNLNAPRAVTLAAVIYFLRVLVGHPIPLNSGCLRNVEVTIPTPSILSPSPGRAVAGGNVETSQRIVDVLFAAVGLAAASQGTMNNLTFGGEGFAYYETIAGGAGATATHDGASAVHTHMTNTRITDPEILESRFPVRLERFEIRKGSGGAGARRGGDGVIRELTALVPMEVSILSQRRTTAPFGLAGGESGVPGKNSSNGRELPLAVQLELGAGECVRIETPGGGGYGRSEGPRRTT